MSRSISWRNTRTSYGATSRLLHWATVIGVVASIVTAEQVPAAGAAPTGLANLHLARHAGFGLVVFALAVARMGWRRININPIYSYSVPDWQKRVALFVHWSIYATLMLLTLSGLPALAAMDARAQAVAAGMHAPLSILLFILFGIHLVAAAAHRIFGVAADGTDQDAEARSGNFHR